MPQSLTTKEIEYTRPWMYQKQSEAFFTEARYSFIEASTKSGKTVGALAWLWEKALFGKRNQNRWWVAPVYPQAEIAYRRLKQGLPREIYEMCVWNETSLRVKVPSGGFIWFKSGEKPDTLFGEDVYDAVIDEASRVRQESWHAVRSTITATQGSVRIIGNVKGRKNWFYNLARKAEAGGRPRGHGWSFNRGARGGGGGGGGGKKKKGPALGAVPLRGFFLFSPPPPA